VLGDERGTAGADGREKVCVDAAEKSEGAATDEEVEEIAAEGVDMNHSSTLLTAGNF
jgi:hypothetical protein